MPSASTFWAEVDHGETSHIHKSPRELLTDTDTLLYGPPAVAWQVEEAPLVFSRSSSYRSSHQCHLGLTSCEYAPLWVKTSKVQIEQMFSGLPPEARPPICAIRIVAMRMVIQRRWRAVRKAAPSMVEFVCLDFCCVVRPTPMKQSFRLNHLPLLPIGHSPKGKISQVMGNHPSRGASDMLAARGRGA